MTPTGSLYSFDGRSVTKLLSGITVSNGLTWSPDHKTFYYIDTPTREVRAFDYDIELGAIANSRVAIYVNESLGWPDGMTSDTQGNLWIAMWGGAQITKWDPQYWQIAGANSSPGAECILLHLWRKRPERTLYYICTQGAGRSCVGALSADGWSVPPGDKC